MSALGAIGAGTSLIGGILNIFGRRRARNEGKQEDNRLEQETRRRATAKAALMRGIMQSSGYGGMMTDEQMRDYLLRTERRGSTAGGTLMDIGNMANNVGNSMMLGAPGSSAAPGSATRSSDFWQFLDEQLAQRAAPPAMGSGTGPLLTGIVPR